MLKTVVYLKLNPIVSSRNGIVGINVEQIRSERLDKMTNRHNVIALIVTMPEENFQPIPAEVIIPTTESKATMKVKRGVTFQARNFGKSQKLEQLILDQFKARTTMGRAYFVERLIQNGFQEGKTNFSGRAWYHLGRCYVAIGQKIRPHGITVVNIETHKTEKFNDYGNAWEAMRKQKYIGLK